MTLTIQIISDLINAEIIGDKDKIITDIKKIEEADNSDITFLHNPKYFPLISKTKSGAVIVPKTFEISLEEINKQSLNILKVDEPYAAFLTILKKFYPVKRVVELGIAEFVSIDNSVKYGKNVAIDSMVSIKDNTIIGNDVQISSNVSIGRNVSIGNSVIIYSNCSIRDNSILGNNVILQNGAVIGSDGFGFSLQTGKFDKIPQVGNVILEDDVEIGANTVIDRATMGSTVVKKGTKLDNLIQVAHNVEIGNDTVIAAQTGISGSTKIGSNCMIGGQVGFVGHVKISNRTMVGAQAGVTRGTKEGDVITGYPARDMKKMRYIDAAMTRLPDLVRKVREIEKKLAKDEE